MGPRPRTGREEPSGGRRPALEGIPPSFWRRASRARRRLLMLDYDGTLAPFRAARMEARPLPGMRERIERVAEGGRTTVAIVSGRPIAELDRLLPGIDAHLVGEHGWEVRVRGGSLRLFPLAPAARAALARAERAGNAAGLGAHLERKRTSLVLHLRGLSREKGAPRAGAFARIREEDAFPVTLVLAKTNGGLELRAAGRTKGTAVQELIDASPAGIFPVYVGDDRTDEDAFRTLRRIGFGVRVERGAGRASSAGGRLRSCAEVRLFLARWAEEVAGEAARSRDRERSAGKATARRVP